LSAVIQGTPREVDGIPLPTIRALHRTLCVFKGNQANSTVSQIAWSPTNNIFGRFTSGSTKQSTTNEEPLHNTMAVYCPGLRDQFPQEHNLSNSTDRVLWVLS